jgi:hypothetical protein
MEIIWKGSDITNNITLHNSFDYKSFLQFIHTYISTQGIPNPTPEQIEEFDKTGISHIDEYERIIMD